MNRPEDIPPDVKGRFEFLVRVDKLLDDKVRVLLMSPVPGKIPFEVLMPATEYMINVAAQESNAGYEKAMELLCKGAMTYRNLLKDGEVTKEGYKEGFDGDR